MVGRLVERAGTGRKRFVGAPAQAAGAVAVTVTGPPSGVAACCPGGTHPSSWTVTDGDGSPPAGNQRLEWTVTSGPTGIGAWIAPYDHSPPPPAITLTVVCAY